MTARTLLVEQGSLSNCRLRAADDTRLADGQARVRIELFSLTANNITYAAFGEAMGYWRFFPSGEAGWGIVPVWGFGTVVQSLHPGVAVGERLYGYWPMANEAILAPARLTEAAFVDAQPHRAELPPIYNQYLRTTRDPLYTPDSEAAQAILRPLFTTSWLIDDFFADNAFFGAKTLLLSSASSKTAYGTAFMLAQREGIEVVGLTSEQNKAFCESLGCYARVLTYGQLDAIAADTPCAYIDFAGNAELRRAIHTRFSDLKYSCAVGGTHVEHLGGGKDLPGPRPTLFFAPAQAQKRAKEWGGAALSQRIGQGWHAFLARALDPAQPWLRVLEHRGPEGVQAAYAKVLSGRSDPRTGHVATFQD
jgi:hypothetical protein